MHSNTLSKYHLINAYYCTREPYLSILKPEEKSPNTQLKESVIKRSESVKSLARNLFPEGIDLSNGGTVTGQDLINKTRMVLNADRDLVFFNAAFMSSDRTMQCTADIFVVGSKRSDLYILKSATRIKEPDYIMEAGFKYSVLKQSNYEKPIRVFMVTLNKDFVFQGKYDVDSLFIVQDITNKAKRNVWMIMKYKRRLEKTVAKGKMPQKPEKVSFCTKPHKCNFYTHCWKNKPDKKGKEPYIQINKVKKHFGYYNFDKPHYYIEIGTFQYNVPRYIGTRPYQRIPYQYCCLYKKGPAAKQIIKPFYSEPDIDPRMSFITNFLEDTKQPGLIFVYSKETTKTILEELVECFPAHSVQLKERIARLKFIEEPFEKPKRKYQHRVYYYPKSKVLITLANAGLVAWENDHDKYKLEIESYYTFSRLSFVDKINLKRSLQNYCYKEVLSLVNIITYYLGK